MTGAIRIWAAAFFAALAITRADAADLTPTPEPLVPAPPIFFVHVGALGVFPKANAQSTGGGFFNRVSPGGVTIATIENVTIPTIYTVGLEAGYFITPNIALALSAGIPPIAHIKATGLRVPPYIGTNPFGTDLLGSVRFGPAILLLQYHFTQFGAIQPYFGAGPAYVLNFGNISDGILTNFTVDQNFAFVVQGGVDLMLGGLLGLPNWGVFVDGKRIFYSTDAFGFALGSPAIPIRTHVNLDSWLATAGLTFKY